MPHFDGSAVTQFVTIRLADSLPQNVLEKFRREIEVRFVEDIERRTMISIENFLDSGYGKCFLRNKSVAEIVRNSLIRFDGERYKLFAWVIMPNHIHILMKPIRHWSLNKILHSFKSFTALEANKSLDRSGKFWMREYFDRYIRDAEHFEKAFLYIVNNPVKAGFCEKAEDWQFSSASSETPTARDTDCKAV